VSAPASRHHRPIDDIDTARLRSRSVVLSSIREFFRCHDYLEINPPVLVPYAGLEPHIDSFSVTGNAASGFLQTSPEYALKTLLGVGLSRIYAITPCFRDEPRSATHSPQFTMLEWYREGADLHALMDETEALIKAVAQKARAHVVDHVGTRLLRPFERITVRDAFQKHAALDPWSYQDATSFADAARANGFRLSELDISWDSVFFEVFMSHVEPKLGLEQPTLLWGWPTSQAALARIDPNEPNRALRFELYAGGFELANAFDELTCAVEQRARLLSDQEERTRLGRPAYPIDERFLTGVERMVPAAGIALGLDRLMMLLTGATHIEQVQAW
jgi:lysyl-tRNA synthetase class 2